jgi:hypothetical protein
VDSEPIRLGAIFDVARRAKGAIRVKVCDVCGQAFDTSDLDEVFHHGPAPHARRAGPEIGEAAAPAS